MKHMTDIEPFHHHMRILEALLFASSQPLSEAILAERLPKDVDIAALLKRLQHQYEMRGVVLQKVAGGWAFRTAEDLAFLLQEYRQEQKRLSRAALETLAIIAYHQPVTRADIEHIRGVSLSKGTLDILLETGWICLKSRRRSPGRPVTYGTSAQFLDHFNLAAIDDLPGVSELKAAGFLEQNFSVHQENSVETSESEHGSMTGELFASELVLEDHEA